MNTHETPSSSPPNPLQILHPDLKSSSVFVFCWCKVEATLRYSNTIRNPRRPFLGCPKYNSEGLPYCKFFMWADSNQEFKAQLQEKKNNELLRNEKELEQILDDVEKIKTELRKRADEVEKREMVVSNREMVLLKREAEIRRSHTILLVYWAFSFVVVCWLVVVVCK